MAILVINSPRFDFEWNIFISSLPNNQMFDLLTALKEGVRDYVSVTNKGSPLFIDISGHICKLDFLSGRTQNGYACLKLQSIQIVNASNTHNINPDFSI